ncbi:phage tail sheath family protein [Segetibacter sp. 3557_3]|uniref:phage tail sheath family protein n=1 Tax=Segetibacter sp. 3557_3 TaxID=2547429 RepID=UPI001058763A|nr:phage tail sheath C-terminal domain-containing protein [Segetibacter sp. 3557_3]TDH27257.1 phage tail sheath family protein [Segetibacter sp. 3557_3]
MATYKTPGVYVEEISTLPPSVAEVETAIPAFIGFTERGLPLTAKRITSFKEYEDLFGGAEPEQNISVIVEQTKLDGKEVENVVDIHIKKPSNNVMYYAMQLYYANGGGPCYVIPAGNFAQSNAADIDAYTNAIHVSSREDEPTILVLPDAPFWLAADQYYTVINNAIHECTRLGDRFTIVDVVVQGDARASIQLMRDNVTGAEDRQLKYSAAYFPYLNTQLSFVYRYNEKDENDATFNIFLPSSEQNAIALDEAMQKANDARGQAAAAQREAARLTRRAAGLSDDDAKKGEATDAARAATAEATRLDSEATTLERIVTDLQGQSTRRRYGDLTDLSKNQIKKKISELGVQLTPCAAMAGIYASVDNSRGVWKAPANVSLNYVTSTNVTITHDDQEDMNIDVNSGKSVNALRTFVGKGTLVWGARTLDGNSNEWRYVNVRRFFNMVEESVKKSTHWAVFEPNDKNTWVRLRAMIENYLTLKWREGALAGSKPDDAFYVRVGLGQTMSPFDVLEGRMIVEIGLAAVRPAEFIILKFSHKMQTS